MKLRYELHRDYENGDIFGIRYLPNNRDSGGDAKYVGKHCNASACVLECRFWPKDGYLTEDGNIYYDDPNFDEEFYGRYNLC